MRTMKGFTLFELVTTIAVAGVALSLGVPTFVELSRSNRAVTYTNELLATLHTARAGALTNTAQVTICKSADLATCDSSASWDDGWIVFIDSDEDEVRDLSGTPETLLRARGALHDTNTLTSAAFDDWVAFRPNGLSVGSSADAGTFALCDTESTAYARVVNVSRTGSPSLAASADGACP